MEELQGYTKLRLIPVEVFGTTDCCKHGINVDCESTGFGLSDAVSPWSDCNRASGHIYRVDDMPSREPGESVEVLVKAEDAGWFKKYWGERG